jgi:proteasome maturation protein
MLEIGKGVGEEEESRWCFFSNKCKRVLWVFQDRLELPHDVLGSHDTLRHGLPALKNEALPMHPVEVIQNTTSKYQQQTKRTLLEKVYGSAFPMKMDIERQILSKFQRPPGLVPSSMLGLESLTGSLDDFGFEDYLNDPRESETLIPVDMHQAMEVRLGLSKGPVSRAFL